MLGFNQSPFYRLSMILLAGILLVACDNQDNKLPASVAAPVVVLKAHTLMLSHRVEALGTAQAEESVTITARVAGRLDEIAFSDGQRVNKGDVIARMDQRAEQAQLIASQAQLHEHQRELKRLKTLLTRKATASRTVDERKTLLAVTASRVKEIKAKIDELTLIAPFDGKLGIRRVSPGAMIQPGTMITTLDATEKIKLDFTIPSTELSGIAVGAIVEASTTALPREQFIGRLTSVDSRIDPLTRSLLLRAEIDNQTGRLIPGMLMRVVLKSASREALVVPEESITQRQGKHFLTLVDENNKVELRVIEIGLREDGLVEIRRGLTAGEQVVVRGMGFVRSGQLVTIKQIWTSIDDRHASSAHAQ